MNIEYGIYCDESSHLEFDNSKIMGLGALICPTSERKKVFKKIREIKIKHNLPPDFEIKWTKVSNSKIDFYFDLVDFYFSNEDLGFRSIMIEKSNLNHPKFNKDHDEFYYKMIFILIKQLLSPSNSYKIYLDKKDTKGKLKIDKLHNFLCSNNYDINKEIVKNVQEVVSHQIELIQMSDLLLGAVCYTNRNLATSEGKLKLINRIRKLSGYSLVKTTLYREFKMNTLIWKNDE